MCLKQRRNLWQAAHLNPLPFTLYNTGSKQMDEKFMTSAGWVGLSFWGLIFVLFLFWRTLGRYLLSKEIASKEKKQRIENKTAQPLSARRETFIKPSQRCNKIANYILSILLIFFSLSMIFISIKNFPADRNIFELYGLILVCLLIPAYFGIHLVISITNDILKRTEELEKLK